MITNKIDYRRRLNQWCIDSVTKWVYVLNNLEWFFNDPRAFDNSDPLCNNFKCVNCPYYKHWTISCIEEGSYFDEFIQTRNPEKLKNYISCMIKGVLEFKV